MRAVALLFVLLSALVGFADDRLAVHEWGTFTSLQDEAGESIGGINTDDEPVPYFVHDLSKWLLLKPTEVPPSFFQGAPSCHPDVTMRLETPVIYFHPSKRADLFPIDVRVRFQGGWLTQFYPDAQADAPGIPPPNSWVGEFGPILRSTIGKLSWKLQKIGVNEAGPETSEHVWIAPRVVEAASIQTEKGEVEKFLFYRGVGHINAPLRVLRSEDGKSLLLRSHPDLPLPANALPIIRRLWLVEIRRDGTAAFRKLPAFDLRPGVSETTPSMFDTKAFSLENMKHLRDALHEALMEDGLFADEAAALLNTWELSYFKSAGMRLFFIVPRAWTDHYLSLEISVPAEVKRVMVGRIELVTPEHRSLLQKIAARSAADVEADRKRLYEVLNGWGGGIAGSEQRERYEKVREGRSPISSLGTKPPELYQSYLDLGRFRNALILDEVKRHPSEGLRQFIRCYQLAGYTSSLVSAARKGDLPLVKALIAEKSDLTTRDFDDDATALCAAAGSGQSDIVNALIAAGADVNAKNSKGEIVLMYAVAGKSLEVVASLIKAGADVNASNKSGETVLMRALSTNHVKFAELLKKAGAKVDDPAALMEAATQGNIPALESLTAKGVDVNMKTGSGVTPLMAAVLAGKPAAVETLIAKGADVKYQDPQGQTCLMAAVRPGKANTDLVKLLIAKGADVNTEGKYHETALSKACDNGCTEIVKFLIESGVDAGAYGTALWEASNHPEIIRLLCAKGVDKESVRKTFERSVQYGRTESVKAFFDVGVNLNEEVRNYSNQSRSPLTLAAEFGQTEIVKLLITKGIDINGRDNSGNTALMIAAGTGRMDMVRLLIEKGADANVGGTGNAALNHAVWAGKTEIVKFFIDRGADVNAKAADGRTLLMDAASGGHVDTLKFFIGKGLDVNAKTDDGWTALMLTVRRCNANAAKLLLDHGADVNARNKDGQTALGMALKDEYMLKERKAPILDLLRRKGGKE